MTERSEEPLDEGDRYHLPPRAAPAVEPSDPAAFRLRPERAGVMRLSRRALGLIAGVSALTIGGALVWALQSSHPKTSAEELYNTDRKTTAEGLARLPGDYASADNGVPRLGPPLPGDLGRPIVQAGVASPPIAAGETGAAPPAPTQLTPQQQSAEQARQRRVQEVEAARTSRLFASEARNGSATASSAAMPTASLPASSPSAATGQAGSPPPGESDRKLAFLNRQPEINTTSLEGVSAPLSPYVLQAGAVIPAALITGIRSDLPGQVTAQVTENVYDGPTGRFLLIPQGARLIGQYDAEVDFGQSRALLVWNRLIMPNGRSIVLERQPGADPEGYAGVQDRVNNHWGQLFRAAILSTLLSVGSEAGTSSDESDLTQALRRGASDSISQTGRQVVGRSLNIQPTITIRPGFPVRVIVTRDLLLQPYRN